MLKKLKRTINEIKLGLALGMANADKEILNGSFTKAPEGSAIMNPVFSRNDFLKSIQLGQLKEEQIVRFYQTLDAMDYIHGRTKVEWIEMKVNPDNDDFHKPVFDDNGKIIEGMGLFPVTVPMSKEEVELEDAARSILGDYIEGYQTKLIIKNKNYLFLDSTNINSFEILKTVSESERIAFNYTGQIYRPTMIIMRNDNALKGGVKIEDFCQEVYIKLHVDQNEAKDNTVILELYCQNYNWRQKQFENDNGLNYDKDDYKPNLVYNKIMEGLNLTSFIDFQEVLLIQNTATRNYIPHHYKINSFIEIKIFDKGFVVKFNGEKI